MLLENTDVHTRTWLHLQTAEGATVELAPGEQVELDVPDDFTDPYLKPAVQKRGRPTEKPEPTKSDPEVSESADAVKE